MVFEVWNLINNNNKYYKIVTWMIDDYDRLTDWIRHLARGLAIYSLTDSWKTTLHGLIRSELRPTIYHTPDEYANHYTTDAVSSVYDVLLCFL
jgi:hypothetical protein